MAVSGKEDIVANVVVVEVLKCPVTIRNVALGESVRYLHENEKHHIRRKKATLRRPAAGHGRTHVPVVAALAGGLYDVREDDLVPDDAPRGAPLRRLAQLVVEPVLLVRAHERAARVVSDVRDVIVVPAFDGEGEGVLACRALIMAIERKKRGWGWQLTQTSDAAVVVARVDNDQVHQLAQLERPPHAEVVVQIDLIEIAEHKVFKLTWTQDQEPCRGAFA